MIIFGRGPSARALRQALLDLPNEGPAVRWGARAARHTSQVLNETIVFDKLKQLYLFQQEGLPTPTICEMGPFPPDVLGEEPYVSRFRPGIVNPDLYQWLCRRRHHYGGTDIIGPLSKNEMLDALRLGEADYAVQFIDKTHEWRVHVFTGTILRIARKVWRGDDPVPRGVAWNAEARWHFQYNPGLAHTTKERISELARCAVRCLRMDFGAVDIINTGPRDRRNYYVLEVNSAPGIADNLFTLHAYTEAIRRWVGGLQQRR